jgi:2-alkyl-3-oxoalkanoate reductase
MKVAIIGAGHIAGVHAPAIKAIKDAELVAVCDLDEGRARATATELKAAQHYSDPETMFREARPDIVHVLTPPATHCPLSIMAAKHGCNVLVEKPIALNADELQLMLAAAAENNVLLCTGHNMVFDALTKKAKKLVSDGVIGDIVSVEASMRVDPNRYGAIRAEGAQYAHWIFTLNGGPLQDLLPHPASLALEFMGGLDEVHAISKDGHVLPDGWPDEVRIILRSDGVMGHVSISLNEKPDTTTLSVSGRRGRILVDYFNRTIIVDRDSFLPRAAKRALSGFRHAWQSFRGATASIFAVITGRFDKSAGVNPLVEAFYDAVRGQSESPVSEDKMLNVTQLIETVWPTPCPGLDKAKEVISSARANRVKIRPTVLVTGASGFIGTHLLRRLSDMEMPVRALVRPNSVNAGRLIDAPVEVFQADLADAEAISKACEGIETIIHAGAAMENSWASNQRATIQGTKNVLDGARAKGVARMVHFSSLTVYELLDKAKNEIVTEDSSYQLDPGKVGAYAYSKIEAEKLVKQANTENGLSVTTVRPGMVIGEGGHPFFPHLGFNLGGQLFLLIGKGQVPLPLTYVGNVVDAVLLAAKPDSPAGGVYNLVDDAKVTAAQYLSKFVAVTGVDARIVRLPYFIPYSAMGLYELLAAVGLLRKGITSRAQLKWKQAHVIYDTSRAKRELGWYPAVDMEEAMERTFSAYAKKYLNN